VDYLLDLLLLRIWLIISYLNEGLKGFLYKLARTGFLT
jgi:hypothetical protein